ncbi:unnamed protein product [Phytomonas sp. EM1]|nr:unnamed protein product [Phytomonas sp. EM1]|eukprot:CCW62698.1 unnamed protein product [Phytomonas sp. isolate EM1]
MRDLPNKDQDAFHEHVNPQFQPSNRLKGNYQTDRISSLFTASSTGLSYPSPKQCNVIPGSGVVPKKEATHLVSNGRERPWMGDGARGPIYRVVHPQGFRILKDDDVLERTLRGYFRLPPVPCKHLREERERLRKALVSIEKQELMRQRKGGMNHSSAHGGVVLDGFFILNAAGTDNPEAVEAVTLQCSYLTNSVPEDLSFFTKLVFLDVSENSLNVEDLVALTSLETLHIACNKISSLAGINWVLQQQRQDSGAPDGTECGPSASATLGTSKSLSLHDVLLPNLTALNLSYNRIPAGHLSLLVHFPCLEKLDLSGNDIKVLPRDLSFLTGVTHFALENNQFRSSLDKGDKSDVFQSLSTMPSLVEVNLNHNQLFHVPPLSMHSGRGLCFPSIEIIGVADNQFQLTEGLVELGHLHRTLRQIVLTNNPICVDPRNIEALKTAFSRIAETTFYDHGKRRQMREEGSVMQYRDAPSTEAEPLTSDEDSERWVGNDWVRLLSLPNNDCGHSSLQSAARAAAVAAAEAESDYYTTTEAEDASNDKDQPTLDSLPCLSFTHHSDNSVSMGQSSMQDGKNGFLPDDPYAESDSVMLSKTSYTNVEAYLHAYRIEIVVHESFMPKQSLQFFYATHTCRAGQNFLVTIPPYKEFMDIYRLTRPKGKRSRRNPLSGHKQSSRATRPHLSSSGTTDFVQTDNLNPDNVVADGTNIISTSGAFPEPDQTAAFFITEVEDQAAHSPQLSHNTSKAFSRSEIPLVEAPKRDKSKDKSQRTRLPPVVSPSSVNVHRALVELKNLLRKPLPSLPYNCGHHG